MLLLGIFLVTTEPASIKEFSPIVIPGKIVALMPIFAPFLIIGPFILSKEKLLLDIFH
jgi:hypothetical protein